MIITRTEDGITLESGLDATIVPGASGIESVVVAGGSIDVDVLDPALPFAVRLHSPEIAASWLALVVGEDVAARALADDADRIDVDGPSGHLADVVRRFALGTWLHRWWSPADWPAPQRSRRAPQEWLLDAELGCLAHAAAPLFASFGVARLFLTGADPEVEAGLERRLDRSARIAPTGSLVPDALRADRIASVIVGAAAAILDIGLGDDATLESVAAAETRYWDVLEGETELATDAELAELARSVESWQVRMSGERFSADIDPVDVHPRSLRAPLVSWEIDGPIVRVDIESPVPGSVPIEPGELFARVEVGDQTYAIPLEAASDGFSGERSIDAIFDVAKSTVRVSVYSDRVSAGARRSRSADEIAATRERLATFARARAERAAGVNDFADPAASFAIELEYAEA